MKLTDMKLPERDKTPEERMYPTMAGEPEEYPYGLRVNLDEPQLAALGIKGLPTPGDSYALGAKAHVVSSNESHDESGSRRNVQLQITHMGCDDGDE